MAQTYKVGNTVEVSCISKDSKPAPHIRWLINKRNVSEYFWYSNVSFTCINVKIGLKEIKSLHIFISGNFQYDVASEDNSESKDAVGGNGILFAVAYFYIIFIVLLSLYIEVSKKELYF